MKAERQAKLEAACEAGDRDVLPPSARAAGGGARTEPTNRYQNPHHRRVG